MTEIKTIKCPHCASEWNVESGPEGRGYLRSVLLSTAPAIAAHIRDEHGDEETALRFEKWTVTPPPWLNSTQK